MWKLAFLALAAIFAAGCDSKDAAVTEIYSPVYSEKSSSGGKSLILGVHPLHNPKKLFEVYGPLVDYINANVKGANIKLEASRNYEEYEKKLFARRFDLGLPNPYQTLKSMDHGYRVFGKMGDDFNFRGVILIRKDSGINEVTDLKGKVVSFPAATALAATMMPQYYLHTHGLDVNRDIQSSYVGSQESSIMNVYYGKSAAGATWPIPWLKFQKEQPDLAKHLMVKWQTETLPNNSLVARDDFPKETLEQIEKVIFNMHNDPKGREILERMPISRFESATNATYEPVRKYIANFSKAVRPVE